MSNNNVKVSILIPIYNVEKYLDTCLSSVVSQKLKEIEIICINDGSTDKSLNIIQKFMQIDSRIKLINKQNSGYGDSMNIGLKAAQGEYIGIIESDDIAKKNMFKELYNIAKKNDFPDIVKSNYFQYFSQNNKKKLKENIHKKLCNKIFNPVKKYKIFSESGPAIWSAIYKNKFLKKFDINFLPTPGASYQDTSFNFKTLYFASSMYCTSEAFIKYRQDNINSSVNNKDKVFCINDEFNEIEKTIKDNYKFKSVMLVLKFNTYLWNYYRLSDNNKDIFVTKFRDEFLNDKHYIDKELFISNKYKLLLMLLDSIDSFKKEIQKRKNKFLKIKIKKLISKIELIRNQTFIIYGFNDVARKILNNEALKVSFIIDRNPTPKEYNDIPIFCSLNDIKQLYKNEVFIITAVNKIFIKEIKENILKQFPKSKIIYL